MKSYSAHKEDKENESESLKCCSMGFLRENKKILGAKKFNIVFQVDMNGTSVVGFVSVLQREREHTL